MSRAFEVKQKTFFLVSEVLSHRLTKQTSKKVADTTFNNSVDFYNPHQEEKVHLD